MEQYGNTQAATGETELIAILCVRRTHTQVKVNLFQPTKTKKKTTINIFFKLDLTTI